MSGLKKLGKGCPFFEVMHFWSRKLHVLTIKGSEIIKVSGPFF